MKKMIFLLILLFIVFLPNKMMIKSDDSIHVSASAAILMESQTKSVLYEKNISEQRPIASISKIMTAIIAIENANLNDYVTISKEATLQVGSSVYIKEGDQLLLKDLLYALLLRSGNDAAYAIAEYVGGGDVDYFIFLMNEKAKELGMHNSTFGNPSGLDETTKNVSSAYDMALLTSHAMDNPLYREINNTSAHRATTFNEQVYLWHNKHRLINTYDFIIGGKTGYTTLAKRTLVTVAKKDDIELIVVTLNDSDDWDDHMNLIDYGYREYKMYTIIKQGLFEVKELDKIFYLDDAIIYPLKEDEFYLYKIVINFNEERESYNLYLVKDEEIILTQKLKEYDTTHSDLKNSFTIYDLGNGIINFVREMFW